MVFVAPLPPGAPVNPSGFVSVPGGPQIGAPGVPSAPIGIQSGAPSVPTAPGWPQSGAPGVPTAPSWPQGGPQPPSGPPWGGGPTWGGAPGQSAPMQAVQQGVGHAARGKLLASVPAKIIAAALAVTVVGGAAAGAYVVTRPQPVIQLKSSYTVGTTPAGAAETSFTVSGQKFSSNSSVTFLLDGTPAPDNQPKESDSQGTVEATLQVTDQWSVGKHTLTARDGDGYYTKAGISIEIVAPGSASTPGPNNAPTDLSSFVVNASISGGGAPRERAITVTQGKPCDPEVDTGQTATGNGTYIDERTGTVIGTLTFTRVTVCSGSYQGGKLDYIETMNSLTFVLDNGNTCQAKTPYTSSHFQGTFSDATHMSGTANGDAIAIICARTDINYLVSSAGWSGSWTGTVTPTA